MSVLMGHAHIDSANDHHRGDLIVVWIQQRLLLAACGDIGGHSFSRRGLNKDAGYDAVVALSGAADLVA